MVTVMEGRISMFFRKNKAKPEKNEDFIVADTQDLHEEMIESLIAICEDGISYEDAFVLSDEDIYVYADILSIHDNVVQILFQLHHDWLEDTIFEAIAASGSSVHDAILNACKQYYDQVLSLYRKAIRNDEKQYTCEGFTQERHFFDVFASKLGGIGKKEGPDVDYWAMLKEAICLRLGNKKVYWVKVFASKDKENATAEVWINGKEAKELSQKLLAYAINWDTISAIHTEKQCFLFVQQERSYEKSDFTKNEIQEYTRKALQAFETCKGKQEHVKIRSQLIKWCEDDSLAYEIFCFLPLLFCIYAYPYVEFGEKLFLVKKNEKTRELYQSQLQSYAYIEEVVKQHFEEDDIENSCIQNVLAFSANAKAIQKAIEQGDSPADLFVPGIGYFVRDGYQLR